MKKRFVAFLLVLIMVLGMLPVSALAADGTIVYDGVTLYTNTKPRYFTFLRNNAEGNVTKDVGESGVYQRLPRYTNICSCGRTLVECIPDEYSANAQKTVELSDPTVLKDLSFTISGWSDDDFYSGDPCLTFNYTAAKPGTTNVKLTFYYNYNFDGASGKCKRCGRYANIPAMNTWLQETTTFTVTVGDGEVPNPTKYTYHLIHEFNYEGGTRWDITATTAAESYELDVNKGIPTRDGYTFLGWADEADATAAQYHGGDLIPLTKDHPIKTIYAVWMPFFELRYDANGGTGAPDSQTRTASHPTVNQVTFTVPNQTPTKEGYTFKGWADSATATDAQYQPGGTVAVKHADSPKTVYAVWEESAPQPPLIPVPSYDDLKSAIGKIQVMDVSTTSCGTENYDLIDNTQSEPFNWTKTARLDQPGKYDVTIQTAPYVAKYNSEKTKTHELNNANQTTLRLVISYENSKWVLDDGLRVIEVKHSEQTPPTDKPDKPTALDGSFAIVCKNNEATHAHKADYIATPSQYTISDVQTDEQGYYVTATVTVAPNLVAYNTLTGAEHRLVNERDATLTITFRYDTEVTGDENRKWKQQGEVPVVEVICKPKAPTADDLKKLEMAVQVKCVVDDSQQHTAAYGLLGEYDEDYFVFEPRQEGDDWLCDINYYPERYVAEFNTTFQNLKHVQNDEKIVPVTLIWAGDSWQLKTQGRVPVTEVYTVTYTDGVENEEVFADQVYSDLRKDSTTPAFNGTPTRTGYTFAGWEPEVAETVTQTVTYVAKWEKKTYKVVAKLYVNGKPAYYQNEDFYTYKVSGLYGENIDFDTIKAEAVEQAKQIKKASASYTAVILEDHEPNPVCTTFGEHQPGQATHYVKVNVKTEENVVIFQSFEGKTDLTKLHTTTAPYGTNVVEFLNGLGLDLDVAGYTLDTAEDGNTNWYKKDSPKWTFGANDTINGWTNVLLKYTITPHNIYAFARLNSAFAPLTSVEFGEFVKLNDATLTRLGLGSYNANNYISIGTFSFNKLPLMGDDFMSYYGDEEFDAVVAELADNIVLETGVSKEVAEKIAWTYLFKADNSDYMTEAGYPTDDENGYQLSGNLNLASVTFRAGAENVENMPAVNYTYDDGAIDFYDFYFAGDTITLPTTEPTREGYSFEGWSVKVIPAENDADHLDADGADDAADETLLKAGDTYTITAGGVIFTAQWEKKTFTVKYYLPDETGAWVEKKMDTVDSVDYATYSLWTPNAEDGYEFSGWYQKTADIGVKAKVEKLYMAKEWKLYGKFTPIEYTIQYVYNDGKATSTNPTTYTVESDTITLADATGADWGKTFLEWHDENGQKITEIPTGSTGDRVITAYWNWPVHLHYLDKDNNEIESATLYVSELEPGACVLPTGEKTGYDFDGWYEAKKDIGTASHKLNALSIAKKWELYGRYTAKTDVSYTVKYLREGDNKVLAPEKVVTDQTFDTEVTEQAADVVGYTPDAPSKTMILDEYNKVLTFSYSAKTYRYEIHYFLQEPDGSYMEKEVDTTPTGVFDTTVTITPDPNRYGAHYSYNSVKSVVSGVVTVDDPATILKLNVYYDLDFHTLTFDTMGGSAIDPVTVRHGNAVARPADPTKDKYTFIGWYVDPEFSAEYDFDTVLEADKTIYAKFELTSTPIGDIYVRYDVLHIKQLPDGSYDLANAEVEHLSAKKDTTVTAVVKDYRATHHINVNSTLSKLTDTAIQPYPGADGKPVYTILSVYYDLDFHTLTFDTMGGSRIDPVTVRHGNAVAKPKDPVNGGYIFDGWYTDKTYRTPYNFATVLTQDTTIYAKWFLIALPGVTIKKTTPKLNTSDHFAYVQGYPDGTVKPTGNITRAETAAILFRLMDEGSRKTYYSTKSGFRDVATGSWYNTYVATLNNAGVITDSSNGYFRPNEAITRAELAAMLANFTETAGAANYFNDVSARYWAANAIAICAKLGWITGYPDGSFRPDRNVTRAELMAMINRATGRAPKSADAFLPGMKTWSDNTADKWYYLDVQEATNSHSYTVKDSEKWTALNADPNWSLYE